MKTRPLCIFFARAMWYVFFAFWAVFMHNHRVHNNNIRSTFLVYFFCFSVASGMIFMLFVICSGMLFMLFVIWSGMLFMLSRAAVFMHNRIVHENGRIKIVPHQCFAYVYMSH